MLAVAMLKRNGFADARRSQQYNGLGGGDVVCPDSLPGLHIEVKGDRSIDIGNSAWYAAVGQAMRDAKGAPWCLLWHVHRQRRGWRLTCPNEFGEFVTFAEVNVAIVLRRLCVDAQARAAPL